MRTLSPSCKGCLLVCPNEFHDEMNTNHITSIPFSTWSVSEIDECDSGPCFTPGTCIDQIDGYQCKCPPSHTGKHCETGQYMLRIALSEKDKSSIVLHTMITLNALWSYFATTLKIMQECKTGSHIAIF